MHAQPLALIQSMKILSRVTSLAFNIGMVIWSFIHMSYLKERDKAKDKNYGNNPITYRSSISVLKYISLRSTHCAIKATYIHANRGVGFWREQFIICVLLSKVIFISKLDKCLFLKGNSNGISSLRNHFVSRQSPSEHLKEYSKKLVKICVIKTLF